jgi:cytochrome c-type biogenesis protein CcmH/NrfF
MTNCGGLESQSAKLKRHLASGKSHDEIIQAFVTEFGGQHILAVPIDRGFNRLAWLVPYGAGITGLVGILLMARRWSRRRTDEVEAAEPVPDDRRDELEAQLDDELRDLD